MKFLYLQDAHIKGKNPVSRKDNYYLSILTKIEEIIQLSEKLKVDYVIDGGDFFNSPFVSNTIVDDILDRIEKTKIEWHMLYGNHPLIGHSIENSQASVLNHIFRRSPYIIHLDTIHCDNALVKGFDYHHNIEKDIKENGIMCEETDKFKIAVTHALITIKPFLPQVMHVVAKNIKTNFDIVLCAHYHQDWGIKEINGTKFINIGCLGRTNINEADVKPKVLYIDTNTQEIKIILLKNIHSKEEAFDVEKIAIKKQFEKDIVNFIDSLDSSKIEGLNLRGLIEDISKKNNVPDEVTQELINRIGRFED